MAPGRKGKAVTEKALSRYLTRLIERNAGGKSPGEIEKKLAIFDGKKKGADSFFSRYLKGGRKMSENARQTIAKSAEKCGWLVDVVKVEVDGEIYEIEIQPGEDNGWQSFNFNQFLGDPDLPEKPLNKILNEVRDEIKWFLEAQANVQKAVDQMEKRCLRLKFGTFGRLEEDDSPFDRQTFMAGSVPSYFEALRTKVAECQIGFPSGTKFSGFDRLV